MTRYYYETHAGDSTRTFLAKDDNAAISRLKYEFGEHLVGVMIVYASDEDETFRTVWIE